MYRLVNYSNALMAQMLIKRLQDAGISCVLARDVGSSVVFGSDMTAIWIDQCEDMELSRKVLAVFDSEIAEWATDFRCKECGYDLSGHTGGGKCPECGKGFYTRPEEQTCPVCGEQAPGNFIICWSCGHSLEIFDEDSDDD